MLLVTGVWPIRNFVLFGNPTYPFPMPIFPAFFSKGLSDTILAYDNIRLATMPYQLIEHSNLYNFVYSALEISRWQSTIPMGWSLDGGHPAATQHIHNRLGGWFALPVVTLFVCFLTSIFPKRLCPKEWLFAVFAAMLLTACLPQSQELRYSLYIPITLAFIFALNVNQFPKLISSLSKILIFGSTLWVMHKLPLYDFTNIFYGGIEFSFPEEAKQFWASSSPNQELVNVCGKTPHTIFWAGRDLNTFKVKGCF